MQNEPRTVWGHLAQVISVTCVAGSRIMSTLTNAVEVLDDQVFVVKAKQEESLAIELDLAHEEAVQRGTLAAAKNAQALVDYAEKNPKLAGYMKETSERLSGSVERFRARKAAKLD